MGEYEKFMETAVKEVIRRMEQREIKAQRAMMPKHPATYYGLPSGEEKRTISLGSEDKAFLNYIRKGVVASELKALVEDDTGRYLVSPEIESQLERSVESLVVVRQLASKRTMTKESIKVRSTTEASVDWGKLETGAAIPESSLTPAEVTKYVEDLNGLTKIGEDELEDSDYDLASFVIDTFSRAIATTENLGFLKGAGHASEEPEGICTNATLLANALTTVAAGAVTVEDFLQCIYAVPARFRQGSSWIVNSLTELELRKLRAGASTTTDGPFLWQPSVIAGAPATFLGYPIYCQDEMDDLSDTEGVIAIFGNFSQGYRILDRRGVTVQRLDQLYIEAGLIGYKIRARVGGYCIRSANKALVLLKEHSA